MLNIPRALQRKLKSFAPLFAPRSNLLLLWHTKAQREHANFNREQPFNHQNKQHLSQIHLVNLLGIESIGKAVTYQWRLHMNIQ
jgi:hypothetical protein